MFEMDDRAVVELDGGKYTVEQALEKAPIRQNLHIPSWASMNWDI